jgi:hypothetical protein
VAELELGRNSRKSKVLDKIVKYWLRILHMDRQDLVRDCYEWQINNLKLKSWVRKPKVELNELGLTFIWQAQQESNIIRPRRIIQESCNDIEGQHLFSNVSEKCNCYFIKNEIKMQ